MTAGTALDRVAIGDANTVTNYASDTGVGITVASATGATNRATIAGRAAIAAS
jgi:hypothetical protein